MRCPVFLWGGGKGESAMNIFTFSSEDMATLSLIHSSVSFFISFSRTIFSLKRHEDEQDQVRWIPMTWRPEGKHKWVSQKVVLVSKRKDDL